MSLKGHPYSVYVNRTVFRLTLHTLRSALRLRLSDTPFSWGISEPLVSSQTPASVTMTMTMDSRLSSPSFPLTDFRTLLLPVSSCLLDCSSSAVFSFSVACSLNNNVRGCCIFSPLIILCSSPGISDSLLQVSCYLHDVDCQVNTCFQLPTIAPFSWGVL